MLPMIEALAEIEKNLAQQNLQKEMVICQAKQFPFNNLLIRAMRLSAHLASGLKYYTGYFDESYGYVLGLKDYLYMLQNFVLPYGDGLYEYEYMDGEVMHKSSLYLKQILEQISTNVSDASKVIPQYSVCLPEINQILTSILRQAVHLHDANNTANTSIHSYRY